MKYEWRLHDDLSFLSAFTWSRALDNGAASLENGNGKITTRIERARMDIEAPDPVGKFAVDSTENAPDNPAAAKLADMIKILGNLKFEATVTPRGETVEEDHDPGPGRRRAGRQDQAGLHRRRQQAGLALVRGYHLYPYLGGVAVPGHCHRHRLPPRRRVRDG